MISFIIIIYLNNQEEEEEEQIPDRQTNRRCRMSMRPNQPIEIEQFS
jgi:hypothetical protein